MGRNPVVGRQGPKHHAATIPDEKKAKRLSVKQIRSGIGHARIVLKVNAPDTVQVKLRGTMTARSPNVSVPAVVTLMG